jgi:SAM-dependent MidA family methyltransferase
MKESTMNNDRVYYSKEAEELASRQRFILVITAIALGVGFGSVIALLLAPQSGEKTRQQIGSQVETTAKDAITSANRIREDVAEAVQK